jgi:hypothetical protein
MCCVIGSCMPGEGHHQFRRHNSKCKMEKEATLLRFLCAYCNSDGKGSVCGEDGELTGANERLIEHCKNRLYIADEDTTCVLL